MNAKIASQLQLSVIGVLGVCLGLALTRAISPQEETNARSATVTPKREKTSRDRLESSNKRPSRTPLRSEASKSSLIIARLDSLKEELSNFSSAQHQSKAQELHSLPWGEHLITSRLLFQSWGATDPEKALAFLAGIADPENESGNLENQYLLRFQADLFEGWASVDPIAASRALESSSWPLPFRASYVDNPRSCEAAVAAQWSLSDPQAALAWAKSKKDASGVTEAIYQKLAAHDLSSAKLLMSSSQDPGWTSNLIFNTLAETDWAKAQEFKEEVGDNEEIAWDYSSQLAKRDLGAAIAYISQRPKDEQSWLTKSMFSDLIEAKPLEVLKYLENHPEVEEAKVIDYGDLMESLTYHDPATAACLALPALAGNPQTSPNSLDAFDLIRSWTRSDPDSAKQWVENLPKGEFYEEAFTALVNSFSIPLEERIQLLNQQILDPQKREQFIEEMRFSDETGF